MSGKGDITLQITIPVGAGNTLYTKCGDCALHFMCPNSYGGNMWCNKFDFSKAQVKIMRKKKQINPPNPNADNPLGEWTEEDWAAMYELLYPGSMRKGASMPAFPSYLKGHQRNDEYRRAREWRERSKAEIKAEIARLQDELASFEDIETFDTPHKQLNLFE